MRVLEFYDGLNALLRPYFRGSTTSSAQTMKLPLPVVFWCPARRAGGRRETNGQEVRSDEAVQSQLLVFWWKLSLRLCAESERVTTKSVTGAKPLLRSTTTN